VPSEVSALVALAEELEERVGNFHRDLVWAAGTVFVGAACVAGGICAWYGPLVIMGCGVIGYEIAWGVRESRDLDRLDRKVRAVATRSRV
jgi:hypothetical protein